MASSPSPPSEPTYTVFIRLPFPRGNFIDPPQVDWDSTKDEALWTIISNLSKTEIDWNDIAAEFHVTVDFLLQQVAWLTERHASQVRAQMRKAAAAAKVSPVPSPQPGTAVPYAAEPMQRTGSGGQPRAPSSTSIRRDDQNTPASSMRNTPRPSTTRTSSSNTAVFTTRNLGGSTRTAGRTSLETHRRRFSSLPITNDAEEREKAQAERRNSHEDQEPDSGSPGPAESSSAASSSSDSSPAQSRIIRRPPRFQSNDGPHRYVSRDDDDDDDDEDAAPAFLQYRPQSQPKGDNPHDLSATLRGNLGGGGSSASKRGVRGQGHQTTGGARGIHHSQTSDSSTSSAALPTTSKSTKAAAAAADSKRPSGPLSPRRTMELAGRSPSGKGKGYSRDSDGTPSMSSSFSDLDDASVTQSALEEALASKMQDGGTIGSLRGTISNAFRSSYRGSKPS
ncbi:hypothetical protein F5Y16DRAFT_348438 [Xylariaceae sp. FL0255]|nr:hypothetical protein F5Y16DRAFT_348438 [Xylariaceae sp. FL0255]